MTVFVDATVLALAVTTGDHQLVCRRLLLEIATGSVSATTSTRVIEELWSLEAESALGIPIGTAADAFQIFPEILPVDEWVVQSAFGLTARGPAGPVHLIHAATCRVHRLDAIISADTAFDGFEWLRRIGPDATLFEALGQS